MNHGIQKVEGGSQSHVGGDLWVPQQRRITVLVQGDLWVPLLETSIVFGETCTVKNLVLNNTPQFPAQFMGCYYNTGQVKGVKKRC